MRILKCIFLFCPLLFFYCDEVEELLEQEIDIETTFITELEINVPNVPTPETPMDFQSNTGLWDFREDPNVMEYLGDSDEITKIRINSVRYFYKDVVGNSDAFVEGEIVIAVGQAGEEFETAVVNLAQADFNNTLFTLEGDFTRVNEALTQLRAIAFFYSGSVSDNPVSFITDVSINCTVTIKPDI
ncbi:hypothetical protein [Winogradskyella sp.]|uniref:hypothetical protein n=1 Tax=Winogradskyella sp. TaxID=1883156 RepID=UPI002619A0B7|nr:hypothetical protein [Winogradskyella sp.]